MQKPRGFYKEKTEWSSDKDHAYFQGTRLKIVWPTIKIAGLIALYLLTGSFAVCILALMFY